MPIASWSDPKSTTPTPAVKAPATAAVGVKSSIPDWSSTPQAKTQIKAAADVAAHPDQHVMNPLNPNNQIKQKPMSLFDHISSIADNIATGATTVGGFLGLQSLMDIPAAARDYVAHPEGPNVGVGDVVKATGEVAKQAGQAAIALPADITIGTYEEATNQQLGPVKTPLGTFQSPQETKRQLQDAGYGPFVSSLGAVGKESLSAANFVGTAVALDDIFTSTSSAIGSRIATEKLSGTLTPAELQAKLDAGEIKTAPGRAMAEKLIQQNQTIKVDLSHPASEIRRFVGENLLGGEAKSGGVVEVGGTPNGFPKSIDDTTKQLPAPAKPTPSTAVGFPKSIDETTSMVPAIAARPPAAQTGFPTQNPFPPPEQPKAVTLKPRPTINTPIPKGVLEQIDPLRPTAPSILEEMLQSKPGSRTLLRDEEGYVTGNTSEQSTFPQWIPPDLRRSDIVIPVAKHIQAGTLPTASKQVELYNLISDLVNNPEAGFIAPGQALNDIKTAIDNFKQGIAKEQDAQRMRVKLVGSGNVRIAQANQLFDTLKHVVKDPVQHEVLNLYRNFKERPGELQQFLDGTHPEFQKAADYYKHLNPSATPAEIVAYKADNIKAVQSLGHLIQAAMNPTTGMVAVDKALTEYSRNTLSEGQKLGILESNIKPSTYVPQFTTPKDTAFGKVGGGKVGGKFAHSKERVFSTPLHALAHGFEPKSLNAFNNFTVYAERFGHAAAIVDFLNALEKKGLANFDKENAPADWKEIRYGRGKTVYLPEDIANAIEVLIDPNSTTIPKWLENTLAYQTFIKSAEVSLSIFHAKALTMTAMADIGPTAALKSFNKDQEDPAFKDSELDGIKHGLTTAIEGRSIEAKKIINETSLPNRPQAIATLPVAKQILQASDALTHATFDIAQRNQKVISYATKVASWMAKHPNMTEEELFNAKTDIAKVINAFYGGLNWDALGVSKYTRMFARAFTFAPDWWWSNILNARYAFEGGVTGNWQDYFSKTPAGAYSRSFWFKAIVGGLIATQLASLAISKKPSKRPFGVYLGKDKSGKELYANWFFVGGPGDFAKWLQNIEANGPIGGTINTLANKMGSIPRAALHQIENKNYQNQDITIKGASNTVNDTRRLWQFITDTAPVPFAGPDVLNLATDPKKEATFWDYLNTMIGSTTTHAVPQGEYVVPSGKNKGQVKPIPQSTLNRPKKSFWDQVKTGGSIYKPKK